MPVSSNSTNVQRKVQQGRECTAVGAPGWVERSHNSQGSISPEQKDSPWGALDAPRTSPCPPVGKACTPGWVCHSKTRKPNAGPDPWHTRPTLVLVCTSRHKSLTGRRSWWAVHPGVGTTCARVATLQRRGVTSMGAS